ncbi:hypothetical protein [Streptomyces sp. NPDC059918]|uniref:hypothetical protein n=1 Tax=unclassified Streptomyces TaxID=2593676 RepID=UPI00365C24D2
MILKFTVAGGNGLLAPDDQSLWMGDWPQDAYDSVSSGSEFLAFREDYGCEVKFNDASVLHLEGVSQDFTNYVAPSEWLTTL